MSHLTRRAFSKGAIQSVLTASLLQTLFEHDAFSDAIKPITGRWLADVNALCADIKAEKIPQDQWHAKVEQLFDTVELKELLKLIDFDKLTDGVRYREQGETSLKPKLPEIEGLGKELAFGHQVFALRKGHSVVPHGHNNMTTGFVILAGEFHGRHYDRLEDDKTHMIIRPTIDRQFAAAEFSTISDVKDNVHWFKATSDTAFIFNIHLTIPTQPTGRKSGRVYIDPDGEKLGGGRIRAPFVSAGVAIKKYG